MSYQLIQGDALQVLPTLAAGSVDCIICDPPYGTTACKWDSVIPFEPMWAGIKYVIKPSAAVVLFGSQPFTSALVMSNPEWYRHRWAWDKGYGTNFQIVRFQPMSVIEDICVFGRPGVRYYPIKTPLEKPVSPGNRPGTRKTASTLRPTNMIWLGRTYTDAYPKNLLRYDRDRKDRLHPSQKPVALLEYLIRTYTNEGETVLDFTMGSGTTGVACLQTGRRFIGIEKDAHYFAIAQGRLEAASQQLRLAV